MATVVLFHHALGLTPGITAFADELRGAGHVVHTPDLFEGRTFESIEAGMAHAQALGFPDQVLARGRRAVEPLPEDLVYAGFSLGVLPAQMLAQTRPGARGALLYHACVPAEAFGGWPAGLPAQIHGMDADPIFMTEGDVDAARALAEQPGVELLLYRGDQHYFADRTLPSYDATAAAALMARTRAFLAALPARR